MDVGRCRGKRNSNEPQLKSQQARAVDLLLSGLSIPEAADHVGVRRETVWRWTRTPKIAAVLAARRLQRREEIEGALADLAETALEALRRLLTAEDVPPAIQLRPLTTPSPRPPSITSTPDVPTVCPAPILPGRNTLKLNDFYPMPYFSSL